MTELLEKRIKEVADAVENGVVVQADAQFLLQMLVAQGDKVAELEAAYTEALEQIEKLEKAVDDAKFKATMLAGRSQYSKEQFENGRYVLGELSGYLRKTIAELKAWREKND